MELAIPAVFVGVILLFIGLVVLAKRWARKRREGFEHYARTWGMSFEAEPESSHRVGFEHLPVFNVGRGRKSINLLCARRDDFDVQIFDYSYVTGAGRSRQTHNQTMVVVQGELGLPKLEMSPEGFWDRVAAALGGQDIDFASSPEFSRLYRLRGEDEEQIRRVFGPELRSFFERHPDLSVQAEGHAFTVFHPDEQRDLTEIRPDIHEALQIARLLAAESRRASA